MNTVTLTIQYFPLIDSLWAEQSSDNSEHDNNSKSLVIKHDLFMTLMYLLYSMLATEN